MITADLVMDERQERIVAALEERRHELASVYRTALALLNAEVGEVDRRTKVSLIAHCMRELMNRVLDAFDRPIGPRFEPSSSEQIRRLPDLLAKFPELELDGDRESVPVPQEIATAMSKIFKAAVQEKRRIRDDVAALITDDGNANHVAVTRWIDSRTYFVKWTHLQNKDIEVAALPVDDEIREHMGVFEELLDGVITAFFTARQSINDLLAEINATGDDTNA
ncbi:hypothetical protein [Flaviflexus massiliensis]|uniref:hypothetical protein n=1 Tax=Flaviflexus massiliensis TaxID=1522309 RepID=UPI0006D5452A|nr:hypothetical protein [Flaviflexus massiliensis]